MAFLDKIRGAGATIRDLLMGQDPSEVKLTPEEEAARQRRRQLTERGVGRALGDVPLGEVSAAESAGGRATSDLVARGRSRVASARTPAAKLLAERQGQALEVEGRTDIARGVSEAATAAEAQALRDALSAQRFESQEEQRLAEERRRRARPGALPVLGTLAGSAFGPQGAAIGGALGSAITRNR